MEDIKKNSHKVSIATLSLAALGVVFGDIGTSPLYTMKEVFSLSKHPVELTQFNVLGILSLIFWSLIMIVSVKYVAFITNIGLILAPMAHRLFHSLHIDVD